MHKSPSFERLEVLRRDPFFDLCRVWLSGRTALLRRPSNPAGLAKSLKRLAHERAFDVHLDGTWAVRPTELVIDGMQSMLLLEDAGDPLPKTGLACAPGEFLQRAVAIATAVAAMHRAEVLHKNIRPDTLLQDRFGTVRLTGFGIATTLPRIRFFAQRDELEGVPAYMAPEQTGRMNRSVDRRSDLYSVGVTLYELLSGRLPFRASKPMDWFHCHVARRPLPLDGSLPQLAAIVMKLLEKPAENRYQTADALEADLRRCLSEFEATGGVGSFPLSERTASERLVISERLYGRDAEIAKLSEALTGVVRSGQGTVVSVTGVSGIGKSSLVNELAPLLVPLSGNMVIGKFDQYRRDVPYATLSDAFRGILCWILRNPEVKRYWQDVLPSALGDNAGLLVDLVPELEVLIGSQPQLPDVPPREAQRRFERVFRRMLEAFADANHPLVLFIDDVQWLDGATLALLSSLLDQTLPSHLLLILAFRTNDVGADHPLAGLLAADRIASTPVLRIELGPINVGDVAALIADTLNINHAEAMPLAVAVQDRTEGSPFFTVEALQALHHQGLIWFEAGRWQWNFDRVHDEGLAHNLLELMVDRLERLTNSTLEAVVAFACLGHSASLNSIALGLGIEPATAAERLHEAVLAGLLDVVSGRYRFVHDSVHEASYLRICPDERPLAHLAIARRLYAANLGDQPGVSDFEIVDQYNQGASLILGQAERDKVAALNITAGRQARRTTAFASALTYFETAKGLLGPARWTNCYRIAFDLEWHIAECSFLAGDPVLAIRQLDALADRALSLADRASIASLQVTLWTALDHSDRAISTGLALLRHAGIDWPSHPGSTMPLQEYRCLVENLASRSEHALLDLRAIDDADWIAVMDVLAAMLPPAFFSDRDLAALVVCRMTSISLDYGNSEASPLAYAYLGMVLGPVFDDYKLGFSLAEQGLRLVEHHGLRRYEPRVRMCFAYHVAPYTRHIRSSIPLLREAFAIAVKAGDLTYSGFCACTTVSSLIAAGEPLAIVEREAAAKLAFVQQAKFGLIVEIISTQLGLVRSMRGLTPGMQLLADTAADERALVARLQREPGLQIALCWFWIRKLQACVLSGDFGAANEAAQSAEPLLWTTSGHFELVEYHFHSALAIAGAVSGGRGLLPTERTALATHAEQLRRWAAHGPANFQSRAAMVDAVLAAADGQVLQAMQSFEAAIRSAREEKLMHLQAMAYEAAALLFDRHGFNTIAQTYLRNARDLYLKWGATAKVEQLEWRYRTLKDAATSANIGPSDSFEGAIDFATFVRTSQAVAGQLGIEQLTRTLMIVVLEHAGADRGLLILPRGGELRVEAEATTSETGIEVHLTRRSLRATDLPLMIVRKTIARQAPTLIEDVEQSDWVRHGTSAPIEARSIVAVPLLRQGKLMGVLYLENSLTPHAFTPTRLSVLQLLSSQAAISLENAQLEEKESLLKEVHHRVKNNLQLISSLLNLQAAQIADPEVAALFTDSRDRVRSMAIVHENLLHAGNFAAVPVRAHLGQLCTQLERAYRPPARNILLSIDVDDLEFDVDRAIVCGLLVNELVSNAYKHAFPGDRDGHIVVRLKRDDDQLELCVEDDGAGRAKEVENPTSLGLQLVEDLVAQVRGSLERDERAGTAIRIRFPES